MNIVLYFLRHFFTAVRFGEAGVHVEKGIFLRRVSDLPYSVLTKIIVKRSLLLRLVGGKHVTLYALSGKTDFYLQKDEALPFLPENAGTALRPTALSVIFGAFVDTRALSGVVVFAALLYRIGRFFGSGYYEMIISALSDTAEGITSVLSALHIAVPKFAAVTAAFVIFAWLFAFAKKLVGTARFRVSQSCGFLTVKSGIVTLYENTLVLKNLDSVNSCQTLTTTALGLSVTYCRNVMILPAANRAKADKFIRAMCKIPTDGLSEYKAKPPVKALFGHCAAPFWFMAGFALVAAAAYYAEFSGAVRSSVLIRSLALTGAAVSLWYIAAFGVFMFRSGLSSGENAVRIAARRGTRLYVSTVPCAKITSFSVSQNPFQRRSGLSNVTIFRFGKGKSHLRAVPYPSVCEAGF
jgi:uncharacterized membrane protein YdbT with pleckstrin-like domain